MTPLEENTRALKQVKNKLQANTNQLALNTEALNGEGTSEEMEAIKKEIIKLNVEVKVLESDMVRLDEEVKQLKLEDVMIWSELERMKTLIGGDPIEIVEPIETLRAFPSAMGAGAYSEGARGGEVVHVTTLADDGVGSLRWALKDASNKNVSRTIIFDVSGIIELQSDIYLDNNVAGNNAYAHGVTIAGQSAPLGNITITGGKIFLVGIDDVVVRYLKFRSTTNVSGCLQVQDGNDTILDHLTGSHVEGSQLAFSLTSNREVSEGLSNRKTFQNCLIHNSGLGLIIGDTTPPNDTHNEEYTVINNAYVDVGWRAPAKIGSAVRMDIINNTTHNHFGRLTRIDDWSYTLNNIGNYHSRGYNNVQQYSNVAYYGTNNGLIYEDGNYYDPDFEYLPWSEFLNFGAALPPTSFSDTIFPINNAETISVKPYASLKTEVLPFIGAYKYINDSGVVVEDRDAFDVDAINRAVNEVNNGASTSYDLLIGEIPTANNTRPAGFYVSNPHIPEAYLIANGLPQNATVHNDLNATGYTQLEVYLNQVDL